MLKGYGSVVLYCNIPLLMACTKLMIALHPRTPQIPLFQKHLHRKR